MEIDERGHRGGDRQHLLAQSRLEIDRRGSQYDLLPDCIRFHVPD